MKRIFALALALILTLGMMTMTASAVSLHCPEHLNIGTTCTEHPDIMHYYIYKIDGDTVYYCWFYADDGALAGHDYEPISNFTDEGLTPEVGMLVLVEGEGSGFGFCKRLGAPAAQPQPKTGVMDTLPMWFGVMAVSACAYVLTSKKRVF